MSGPRGGLGRGLGALIPTGPVDVSRETNEYRVQLSSEGRSEGDVSRETSPGGAAEAPRALNPVRGVSLLNLPVDAIKPNPRQPRQVFESEALAELVVSLREVGVLQPIVVRTDPADRSRYELVMGERRWRAAQQAGFTHIPAILRETPDDDLLRDALLENLHRSQLNPLEEAAAYQQLLEEFGATHDDLAARIGRSRSQVTNTIRLLSLPPSVQRRVAAGVLSAGHARALLALSDPEAIEVLALRIVAEGLSVRSVEEHVATAKQGPAVKPARAPRHTDTDPRADELTAQVSEHLDTPAHLDVGRAKSRLIIEVADLDDLARVVGLITGRSSDHAG